MNKQQQNRLFEIIEKLDSTILENYSREIENKYWNKKIDESLDEIKLYRMIGELRELLELN